MPFHLQEKHFIYRRFRLRWFFAILAMARRLILLLCLLRLRKVLARLTDFCLGGVFDLNVTSDNKERDL